MTEDLGYSPKDLKFGSEARDKLVSGIEKISNAVKSTLGPRGNTVLIESPNHTHGITVTKDGVTVAKSIELLDPIENLAVKIMREAADRTATSAGDGTTTSVVLTEALVRSGMECITPQMNRIEVLRELTKLSNEVLQMLTDSSRKVTKRKLVDIATISSNNDRAIGKIIASVYQKVGLNGIVTVERSQTFDTFSETTEGLKFARGYMSPLFINDTRRDECILEDAHVLVCDTEITSVMQIENVLRPVIQNGSKLLIISPCAQGLINTMAANVMKGVLKVCVVPPPSFGYKQHELMQDIAISVGAKYFSEKTGDDLSLITFPDLGFVSKAIVSKDSTVLIKADQDSEIALSVHSRVIQLREALANTKTKHDKDFILERIASLSGGIGVIYVGGNTDLEQKELYDRVDDAVCAVRSALEEGIVAGGGKALYDIAMLLLSRNEHLSQEALAAKKMMHYSLREPHKQILVNAGMEDICSFDHLNTKGYGFDVKNERWGDLIEMGVIDPVKVTRSALQNAVSVATTILSTNAIITLARTYQAQ